MKREKISLELLLLSDGNPRLEPSFGVDDHKARRKEHLFPAL